MQLLKNILRKFNFEAPPSEPYTLLFPKAPNNDMANIGTCQVGAESAPSLGF
jgi:hypothetical protein